MLLIDFDERIIRGTCKARDVRLKGLLQASVDYDNCL